MTTQEIIQKLLDQDMSIRITNRYFAKNPKEDPKRQIDVEVSYYGQYNCGALADTLDEAVLRCANTVRNILVEQTNKLSDKLKGLEGIDEVQNKKKAGRKTKSVEGESA